MPKTWWQTAKWECSVAASRTFALCTGQPFPRFLLLPHPQFRHLLARKAKAKIFKASMGKNQPGDLRVSLLPSHIATPCQVPSAWKGGTVSRTKAFPGRCSARPFCSTAARTTSASARSAAACCSAQPEPRRMLHVRQATTD